MQTGPPPVGFTTQVTGNQGPGYPLQPNYPPQPGYPNHQAGYPTAAPYPPYPQPGGYPNATHPGYPQPGYPSGILFNLGENCHVHILTIQLVFTDLPPPYPGTQEAYQKQAPYNPGY